jgi:hypothetical protein
VAEPAAGEVAPESAEAAEVEAAIEGAENEGLPPEPAEGVDLAAQQAPAEAAAEESATEAPAAETHHDGDVEEPGTKA